MDTKHPTLMVALGGHPGPEGKHDDAPESSDDIGVDDDGEAMGKDAIDAIKAGDGAGFYAAMRAIVKSC